MFKVPSLVPQDILLIQELLTPPTPPQPEPEPPAAEIQKGEEPVPLENEDDSEEEVEIESDPVLKAEGENEKESTADDSSSSDSSDSDSDSDSEEEPAHAIAEEIGDDGDDDIDEGSKAAGSSGPPTTKNEVVDPTVVVPDITELGADEPIQHVGQIMNIVDNIVIVQASEEASDRALDIDSLLVFEDRKVLGYVYETFGPTHHPFYQVKFTSSFPLNPDIVKTSRDVFHVPHRSKFIFASQLKRFKGSDASNLHDEEVADHEMEFSDDEAEAAYKMNLRAEKRQRSMSREFSRPNSRSRSSTPIPSHMRDQDLSAEQYYGTTPFDEHGIYDMDVGPGPSRPLPIPYDDPYKEDLPLPPTDDTEPNHNRRMSDSSSRPHWEPRRDKGRDNFQTGGSRGRGREKKRGRGRGGRFDRPPQRQTASENLTYNHSSQNARRQSSGSMSPISPAVTQDHAERFYDNTSGSPIMQEPMSPWAHMPHQEQGYNGYVQQQPYPTAGYGDYVQPHINPRFASMLGINMNFMQPTGPMMYPPPSPQTFSPAPGAGMPMNFAQVPAWQEAPPHYHGARYQMNPTDQFVVKRDNE